MKSKSILLMLSIGFALNSWGGNPVTGDEPSLKKAIGDKFLIGVAVNTAQASGHDAKSVQLIKRHFNSIVAENCMKSAVIHPEENRYNFSQADEFVKFGEENEKFIIGHCLIWHSQPARWFCVDKEGKSSVQTLSKPYPVHLCPVNGYLYTEQKRRGNGQDTEGIWARDGLPIPNDEATCEKQTDDK